MKLEKKTKKLLLQDLKELGKWLVIESDKIRNELDKAGKPLGLDTNNEVYEEMHKEFQKKVSKLLVIKYGLSNKKNLTAYGRFLWEC